MRVKRTNSGKFSLRVTQIDRCNVFDAMGLLMEDDTKLNQFNLSDEHSILNALYYTTLIGMFRRIDYRLYINEDSKWVVTRAEAIALMWFLRHHDHNMQMLDMKASLHKNLQS